MNTATPTVYFIAATQIFPDVIAEAMNGFVPDTLGGPGLAEAAGRACYQSFGRPNPETATNAGYLRHILEVGHLSVLEHGSVSFYITGISRSLTHELVRHRHFSYSQLSQRYVNESGSARVVPEVIAFDADRMDVFDAAMRASAEAYDRLVESLIAEFETKHPEWSKTERRKNARQAARSVLPNATETKIVVTGNYRALRHFIFMRASRHADVEIRSLAVTILRQLQANVPNVFADFSIVKLDDGSEAAESPYIFQGE